MSYIRIKFLPVADAETYINSAIKELTSVETNIRAVQNSLSWDIQSRYQISKKLSACKNDVCAVKEKSEKLLKTVRAASRDYQNTESKLRRGVPKDIT